MASKELIDYIKQTLSQNFSEEQIRKELLGAGWLLGDINDAFSAVKSPAQSPTQPLSQIRSPLTSTYPSNQPTQPSRTQPAASPTLGAKRDPLSSPFLSPTATSGPTKQFSNTSFAAPKKSKLGLIIGIIAVIVILGSGGVYAYTQKLWFFAPKISSKEVINNLFANIKNINSASYNLTLSVGTEAKDPAAQPAPAEIPGFDLGLPSIPVDSGLNLKISGAFQTQENSTDNSLQINADVKYSGSSFNGNIDFLNKGPVIYLKLNQLPELPIAGLNLKDITGKWIKLDSGSITDLVGNIPSGIPASTLENPGNQFSKSSKLFLDAALNQSLFVFSSPVKEKIGDNEVYHYQLTVDKTKILPFYQELAIESKTEFGENSPVVLDDQFLSKLQGAEFDKSFEYWSKNSSINLWVDPATSLPQKLSYSLKITPDPANISLKDKQITLNVSLELSGVNQPANVTEPTEFLTSEDLSQALSGLTEEEYLISKQLGNITKIRDTLSFYKKYVGLFPDSLGGLKITGDEIISKNPKSTINVAKGGELSEYCTFLFHENGEYIKQNLLKATSTSYCHSLPLIESIPVNAYDQKDYSYTKVGDDYKLIYAITYPPVSTSTATSTDSFLYINQIFKRFKNGANTATKLWLSQEAKSK